MKFAIKPLIAAAAMASMFATAGAATVGFQWINVISGVAVTLTAPPAPSNVYGALGATLSPGNGYQLLSHSNIGPSFTFCVELGQQLSTTNQLYTVYDPGVVGGYDGATGVNGWGATAVAISARIDQLMAYAMPLLGTATLTTAYQDAAALQLAIWDTIYDLGNNSVSVDGVPGPGGFAATSADTAMISRANDFLALSVGGPATGHYLVLDDPEHQGVLGQIPEPMTAALALLGLLGTAATRRRQPAN